MYGCLPSPSRWRSSSRVCRFAAIRSIATAASARPFSSTSPSAGCGISASRTLPSAIASASSCTDNPVCSSAPTNVFATPWSSLPRSFTSSTITFGSGTPSASTPSTPNNRSTVRSTATVVRSAMKSATSSAIWLAAARPRAIMDSSKCSLVFTAPSSPPKMRAFPGAASRAPPSTVQPGRLHVAPRLAPGARWCIS